MLLRPHDFPAHRTVFNQALAAGSFRGSFFGSGHSAASAFLRHLNFSYFYVFYVCQEQPLSHSPLSCSVRRNT